MALIVYTYAKCSTCRKATAFLRAHGLAFTERPIRETPPTEKELRLMATQHGGDWRRLFNSSGMDYRALGLAPKLDSLSDKEKIELLRGNGNLVKRPFLLGQLAANEPEGIPRTVALVGFREAQWREALGV